MSRMIRAEWMPTPEEKTETQKVFGSMWAKTSVKCGSLAKEAWVAEGGRVKAENPGRCPHCSVSLKRENFKTNKNQWGEILNYTTLHSCGALLKIELEMM